MIFVNKKKRLICSNNRNVNICTLGLHFRMLKNIYLLKT